MILALLLVGGNSHLRVAGLNRCDAGGVALYRVVLALLSPGSSCPTFTKNALLDTVFFRAFATYKAGPYRALLLLIGLLFLGLRCPLVLLVLRWLISIDARSVLALPSDLLGHLPGCL